MAVELARINTLMAIGAYMYREYLDLLLRTCTVHVVDLVDLDLSGEIHVLLT